MMMECHDGRKEMGNTEIGDHIKDLRRAMGGLSQEAFARRLGTTTRTVARWEASRTLSPSILTRLRGLALTATAWEVADFFGTRLQESAQRHANPDPAFDLDMLSVPGTEEERELVVALLKHYRAQDPRIEPIVEQLRAFTAEEDIQRDRELEQERTRKYLEFFEGKSPTWERLKQERLKQNLPDQPDKEEKK
jgi:transcriptional regulator with XRE-family HTH domain